MWREGTKWVRGRKGRNDEDVEGGKKEEKERRG